MARPSILTSANSPKGGEEPNNELGIRVDSSAHTTDTDERQLLDAEDLTTSLWARNGCRDRLA